MSEYLKLGSIYILSMIAFVIGYACGYLQENSNTVKCMEIAARGIAQIEKNIQGRK